MEVITTYSVALGFIVTFGLPLVVAMFLIRPASERVRRRLTALAGGQQKAPAA